MRLPPTSPGPPPLAQTKLPIPCYSTFLTLAWIFFFTSSIFPGLRIPFLPSGRHLPLFPYTRWKSLSTLLLPSGLSLSPPAFQSFFESIIPSRLLFFLESNSILSPRQASFHSGRSTLDQILYLSQSISNGFNKPRPGSWTILSTIDFSKAFDSVWHPARFHKLISAGLPPCFARWTQSFFLIGALLWFIKITKVSSFESVKVFRKNPFLAQYFSLSLLMILRLLCLLPSAALFTLTIWPFGLLPPRSPLRWRPHKEL